MKDHTDNKTGIACLWIGVGSLKPSSARLRNKYDLQLCLHRDLHVEFNMYLQYSTKPKAKKRGMIEIDKGNEQRKGLYIIITSISTL